MNYWQRRQEELNKELEKDETKLKKRLSSFYDTEFSRLEKEIAAYYQKYGENNVIQYRRLMETLPDEDRRLLIERMDEFARKYPKYESLLPIRESIYKLNRLEGLQTSVILNQLEIGAVNNEEVEKHLKALALREAKAAMETMGSGKSFHIYDDEIVKLINSKWCDGRSFSERIWGNVSKLANYLNRDIVSGFARGDSYERLVKKIRERFGTVSRNDAYRLIYTEGTFVQNESRARVFEKDTDQYVFRVQYYEARKNGWRDICDDLNGDVFNWSERIPGINFPPMHAWCHCTASPHISDRKKWMDDYEKRHRNGEAQKVANRFDGFEYKEVATNRFGQEIVFSEKVGDKPRKIISKLASEYDTRLVNVSTGANQAAGSVDMGGNMKLSTQDAAAIIHEFAHSIALQDLTKYKVVDDSEFWKEIRKIRTKYRKEVGENPGKWISSYEHSSRSIDEFFAEAFTHAKMKEMGLEIPEKYGKDFTFSQQVFDITNKYFGKAVVRESESAIIKLPRYKEVVIPEAKFTQYALNPDKDPNKARAFKEALGYTQENAEDLIQQIREELSKYRAVEKGDRGYGMTYEVVMDITGPNKKTAKVLTAWIDDKNNGEMRLTTVHVDK